MKRILKPLTAIALSALVSIQAHAVGIYIPSSSLPSSLSCISAFPSGPEIFRPVTLPVSSDRLYEKVTKTYWELDDNGSTYRYGYLRESQSPQFSVEQYRPTVDVGPSQMWIETLKKTGRLPEDLSLLTGLGRPPTHSELLRLLERHSLSEYQHPLRERHLASHRSQYLEKILPGFEFAMEQFGRRPWYVPEFRKGAEQTLLKTLRNASHLYVRDPQTGKHLASLRFVTVNNGLVRLRHVKTGRTLEILGNSEMTWGINGHFFLSKAMIEGAFQPQKYLNEFLRSDESVVRKVSDFEPVDLIKLPLEISLGIDLPREYTFMDLSGQRDFAEGAFMTVGGENFEVSYGHASLTEPGQFAIEKSANRLSVFLELSFWMGHQLATPTLPAWVNEKKVAYWTYNDLPLYKIFGFKRDDAFAPVSKYGVDWSVYRAGVDDIFPALRRLNEARAGGGERADALHKFLKTMEESGL